MTASPLAPVKNSLFGCHRNRGKNHHPRVLPEHLPTSGNHSLGPPLATVAYNFVETVIYLPWTLSSFDQWFRRRFSIPVMDRLRYLVRTEFAAHPASRHINAPFIELFSEDTYQLVTADGSKSIRVDVVHSLPPDMIQSPVVPEKHHSPIASSAGSSRPPSLVSDPGSEQPLLPVVKYERSPRRVGYAYFPLVMGRNGNGNSTILWGGDIKVKFDQL